MSARAAAYGGATIALLTQHGKERVIAPLFAAELGADVRRVDGFDTDRLGTFTREVPRAGDQLEAARKKARLGAELSGLPLSVASEGAFRPGPFGLYVLNLELVILVDRARNLEIVGRAEAVGRDVMGRVTTRAELDAIARRAGFPEHGLVLRPDGEDDPRLRKGIDSHAALAEAFEEVRARSRSGAVFVESDLRAHMNPTRMENVGRATADLVRRLASACPACAAPGFGLAETLPGLPCADCRTPTTSPRAERLACVACDHAEEKELDRGLADPARCDVCNP